MTLLSNGNTYDLRDFGLSYFITNTQLDKEIQNKNLIFILINDLKYKIYYGVENSIRCYFNKESIMIQLI